MCVSVLGLDNTNNIMSVLLSLFIRKAHLPCFLTSISIVTPESNLCNINAICRFSN